MTISTILFAVPESKLTAKLAESIAGSLGRPSKMPGLSYGISARLCNVGQQLAKIPGSVCSGCYALKANYQYPSVQSAHDKRARTIFDILGGFNDQAYRPIRRNLFPLARFG